MTQEKGKSNKKLIISLHFGFFLTGVTTVLIGQVLPVLINRLNFDDSEAGQLFIAQFFGSFLGVFIFNYALKKFGFSKTILFGLTIIAFAILLINSTIIEICYLGFFLNGIGIGTTLPSINMLIAEINPSRTTSALNILNFFWGVGAIICQPFIAYFGTSSSILLPTIIISILLLFSIIAIFLNSSELSKTSKVKSFTSESDAPKIWKNPTAWLIAIFNLLLVGIESGLGGWLTTYSSRFPDGANQIIAATPLFFLFFVIGRGFAPIISQYLTDNKYITLSLLVLSFGFLITLFANTYLTLIMGASILGLGTSATFPTNMSRFTKIFGETATRNSTPIFVLGSIGGASINWLIGYVSNLTNDLRSGIFILLGCCIVMLIIQIFFYNKKIFTP